MNTKDFAGKTLCEFMKKVPAKTQVRPIFVQNSSGTRVLKNIKVGDITLLIGDNQFDITREQFATKAFKKALSERTLSPQAHNPNNVWLNEVEDSCSASDFRF